MQGGLVLHILGRCLLIMAVLMLPSLFLSHFYEDVEYFDGFLTAIVSTALFAVTLLLTFKGSERTEKLTIVMSSLTVSAIVMAFFAGIPTALHSELPFFVATMFDGMSMLTTTGALSFDGDTIPKSIILWQATMGWLGGFMAVVIGLSIFYYANSGGIQLHNSPIPHGTSEGLYNRFMHAGKTLLPLYTGVTIIGFLLLNLGPMEPFEAFVRALGGVSTHGFNFTDGSNVISDHWSQLVLLSLMLFGALNIDYHYGWLKGKWRVYGQDSESISYLKYMALAFGILWSLIFFSVGRDAFNLGVIWDGIFTIGSMMSTTGVSLPDSSLLDSAGVGVLLISLVVLGGCVVSTSGGVRIMRFVIILRHLGQELYRIAQPHGIATVRYARRVVDMRDLEAVWLLGTGFLLLIVGGTVALAMFGVPFAEALPMAVSATTTTGPLVTYVSPDFPGYVGLYTGEYIILTVLMLFGRIEISLLLGLIVKRFWRG